MTDSVANSSRSTSKQNPQVNLPDELDLLEIALAEAEVKIKTLEAAHQKLNQVLGIGMSAETLVNVQKQEVKNQVLEQKKLLEEEIVVAEQDIKIKVYVAFSIYIALINHIAQSQG